MHIAGLDASDAEDEPGLVEEDDRSPSKDFELDELDATKSDFGSALPSAFSEVGIHTLKSCMISYHICRTMIS